jgi:putative membrane-bound dehydrogenase-like protein
MRDYPNGPEKGQPPEGRIKVLEDKDGDGRYETSRVFAEGLLFANGLLPWKGGVIVTAAPHIVYLKDTDGDGKADQREVLYEGFATENPQLRVSHPVLGLDNWIYVANGLRGGQIKRSGKADAKPINISGMDFRFDPIHDQAEAITGMGQYGNTFDDWGNRFVCTNRNHLIPIVLPNRYVQRNPFMVAPEPVRDNQTAGGAAKIFPLSKNFTTASSHAGTFSASCGVTIYRGDALPKEYRGAAFTCEPTGNLVHMDILIPQGAGFGSKPAFEGKEFLASPDDWFRPVSLAHGPDGALYVVDMYREVIEHPQFMTPEYKARANLTAGKDKGRIWRIVPEKFRREPKASALGKLKTTDLVQLLTHPNSWQRTTAQRLILERQDQAAVPALRTMTSSDHPLARIQAAWLLEAYGVLEEKLILNMGAGGAQVEEHAVRLLERWLPKSKAAQELVVKLAGSPDARVRFQAALSLGEWNDDAIIEPLARIAASGADDKWTRAAVATAVPKRAGMLIAMLLGKYGLTATVQDRHTLIQELSTLAGARGDAEEIAGLFAVLSKLNDKDALAWRMTAINGLAEGMGRRGTQLSVFLNSLPSEKQQASKQAEVLLKEAASVAADAKRETAERVSAAKLLAHANWATAEPVLLPLILQDPAQEVRLAAVRALAAQPRAEVPALLMKSWSAYPPAMRREVMEAMLRQPERIQFLLNELEAKRIKPGDFDALRTRQLVNHGRPEIRERARKLLQDNLPADRKVVLEKYREALKLTGDTLRGKEVFQKNCATCHRVAGVGVEVGPSIADTLGKTPEALLTDVLNPNQAIDNNFINYTVTTKSGKVLTGIIVAETASSITLKRAENQGDVVLRQDLDDIQSTGISLMPEGVEKTINLQEMADLLHFLKNWRYLDEAGKTK